MHLRKAGDDAIYVAALNSFDLPAKNEDWLNRQLLAAADIDTIHGPDYTLHKKGDDWLFEDSATGAAPAGIEAAEAAPKVNEASARELVNALANLRVQGVAKNPPKDDSTASPAAAAEHATAATASTADAKPASLTTDTTIEVRGPAGKWSYHFSKNGSNYYVSRSDRKETFTMSKLDFERITGIGMTQLAQQTAGASSTTDHATGNTGGKG